MRGLIRGKRLVWAGLVTVGLAAPLGVAPAEAADPPEGRAAGKITVDGKSVSLAYAYAQKEKKEGFDVVLVLLTDTPVPADVLRGNPLWDSTHAVDNFVLFRLGAPMGRELAREGLNGDDVASDWSWNHPGLRSSCGYCSELEVRGVKRGSGGIQGTALSAAPQKYRNQTYEFHVAFNARYQPAPAPGADAPAAGGDDAAAGVTAAGAGREEARRALAGRQVDFSDEGRTLDAFMNAVITRDVVAAGLFLEAGISPNARRRAPHNDTPLEAAAGMACDWRSPAANHAMEQIVRAMLSHGADANMKADNGNPVLSLAAARCGAGTVRALVEAGADMDARNRAGLTAMALAVMAGRISSVQALLDLGYDPGPEKTQLLQWAEDKPKIAALLRGETPAKAPPTRR
jgi:hypothetical protein